MTIPTELEETARKAKDGELPSVTVRQLLGWFGAFKRGRHKVAEVRRALDDLGVTTWPDFTEMYFDGLVELRPQDAPVDSHEDESPPSVHPQGRQASDPVPRLGQLPAASRAPLSVCRDAPIEAAITSMMAHNFSQLPVMQGERDPSGYISWRTIGIARTRGQDLVWVRDAMDHNVAVVKADLNLFDAVRRVAENDFVLVEGVGRRITGLVTTFDISLHFHDLSQPFLLISQIEGHLRAIIDAHFGSDDLQAAKNPSDTSREINSASDLSFGEYLRLLQPEDNWSRLNFRLDRGVFLKALDNVRAVRNAVMHFEPDAGHEDSLRLLHDTSRFLESLAHRRW